MKQTPSLGLSVSDNEGGIARPDSTQNVGLQHTTDKRRSVRALVDEHWPLA